jgi:hypothetical protein
MRLELIALTVFLLGCATVPAPAPVRIPRDEFLTQRGILTIRGRQFTLTGYLALSERNGARLIVTHSFGQVLADVLLKPDGAVHVMRPSPVLRQEWIERHVVNDLRQYLANPAPTLTIRDRYHSLELRTVETKPGLQPAKLFEVPQ